MPDIDARPTLEESDDDPYLWLEDIESPRVLDWVEAQNAETLQRFNDAGANAALRNHRQAQADEQFTTGVLK
jgi:prolyl oligopeptidase PreP (S9A serine peptidase family)